MGEIEEITILDQNMNTVAVHNKSSHARYSMQNMAERKREELLNRRINLQKRHDSQTEALLKKHEEERHQIENHPNFSDDEMEYILANVMEPMHQKQLRMMNERHQMEQQVLIDLMFQSAFGAEVGSSPPSRSSGERKSHTQKHHRKDPPEHHSTQASLTSEYLGTVNESSTVTSMERTIDESSTGTSVDESSTGSSISTKKYLSSLPPVPESPNPGANQKIYRAIQQVRLNDPSYKFIDLDGQDEVPRKLWKKLFEAIETNTYVTHISLQDCGLSDDEIVPLLLSLVENETLLAINLSMNPDLTDETGKLLVKVLNGGNAMLCDVDLSQTGISKGILNGIKDILVKRITVDVV